jgi:hypothetical protein
VPSSGGELSHVTMLTCPWCGKETGELALDMRLRKVFERRTAGPQPCKECMKQAIIMFDRDTHKFVGYAKKEGVLSAEALAQFKGTPVKAHVKVEEGGVRFYD